MAQYREYDTLSTDALRVMLAARGVNDILGRERSDLLNLAIATHDCAGNPREVRRAVRLYEKHATFPDGGGPLWSDIPEPTERFPDIEQISWYTNEGWDANNIWANSSN